MDKALGIYDITDYLNLKAQTKEANKDYKKAKAELKKEKTEIASLKKIVPKLKEQADTKQVEHKTTSSAVKNLYKYQALYTPYRNLVEQSNKLDAIKVPDLSGIDFKKIALTDFNVLSLETASKSLHSILKKYESLKNAEEQSKIQKGLMDARKKIINDLIKELNELKHILSLKNEGSIFKKNHRLKTNAH